MSEPSNALLNSQRTRRSRWTCGRVTGDAALVIGCGDGLDAVLVARDAHDVTAVDGDAAALEWLRERLERERPAVRERIAMTAADGAALPLEDESFDAVLLGEALERQLNRPRAIAEAKRVLRRGGRLIVTVPYGDGGNGGGVDCVRLEELLDALTPSLSVVEMTLVGGRLGVVAERKQSRDAKLWRRALRIAERRLDEQAQAIEQLRMTVEGTLGERQAAEASGERERERAGQLQQRIDELETAVAGIAHERDGEQGAARVARQRLEELDETVGRIERDLEREREAAATLQQELAAARETLREREEALQAAQVRGREQDGELTAVRARLEQSEQALASAREHAERQSQELHATRDQLRERERELAQAEAVRQLRERDLERSYERAEDREREHAALEGRLAEERRRVEQLRDESERREGEHATQLADVQSEAERRQREHQAKVAAMEKDAARHSGTAAALDNDLTAVRAALEERERERDEARANVRRSEQELAVTKAQLAGMERRAARFEASLRALRASSGYKLMRVAWRLRRPFRRSSRRRSAAAAASGDPDTPSEPSPAASRPGSTAPPPAAPPATDEVGAATPSAPAAVSASPVRAPAHEPRSSQRLTVASILDEMSAACFAPECDLVPLTLDGWADQLDEHQPDLLLVESAWQGNGGEWHYRIAKYPRKDLAGLPALRALIDGCRKRGIPTVFWNKEDPVHFDRFVDAAALFDHVFTTDARCIDRYRALPGERTVDALPFAAQPRIHNPAAVVDERSSSPCFAGAWYRDRHPDRRAALEAILDAARPYGLVIYDRTFGTDDPAFGFPERFQPHVLGKLPYDRVLDVYKSHRVFLNANSVVDSPTMCSRRVFELAACDTAIVSTPGAALTELLGDAVAQAGEPAAAAEALEQILGDDEARRRRTRAARRAVFAEHTYAHRLATIAEAVGLDSSSLTRAPFATPPMSPAARPADATPWMLMLDGGVELPADTLADMSAVASFANADVIGTHAARNGGAAVEHRLVDAIDPRAVLVRRELIDSRRWPSGSAQEIEARLHEWSDDGVRIYAGDSDWLPTAIKPRPRAADAVTTLATNGQP